MGKAIKPAVPRVFGYRQYALVAALALLAAALWMPKITLMRERFDYVVTFDITQSMNVEDVTLNGVRTSRLAYARAAMRDALRRMPCGSRIGWSVFTDARALLLLPPVEVCEHYDALLASLDGIDGRMRWANASRIANGGLYSAIRQAKQIGDHTAVVFVTDGQEAPPRPPSETSLPGITTGDVGGWLIGVGGERPAPIPRTGNDGRPAGFWLASEVVQTTAVSPARPGAPAAVSREELSQVREAYLQTLSGQIGFGYRRLWTPAALGDALLDSRFAQRAPIAVDLRWCAAVAALLMLAITFMPEIRVPRAARIGQAGARRLATAVTASKTGRAVMVSRNDAYSAVHRPFQSGFIEERHDE
ncbi:MxaL protein [Paraburkholderia sp. 22099]|jgi:mxaL protein|uniref:MxaL protein n=1 Tax=Paraburkholderia terricola TaxID=169427 RepID=A0A1M6RET4_9BURK|nr:MULTISPECIES: MxaL protein [Paraburkholderia]MDR6495863.1 mxaL protein [Paraburkholderia terricola]SDO99782.1 mxaL protein [Paraburkholderia sediminicola]SHK30969.1 mxaL protein [Paraburkholderia terricola]